MTDRVPVSPACPTVSQDTAKPGKSDRVPVSPSIGHGHGSRPIEDQNTFTDRQGVSPVIGRTWRHPGPDLARVDIDVSATGACADCDKTFRTFTTSTTHAAREQHTVQVTELRMFHVVPRHKREDDDQ